MSHISNFTAATQHQGKKITCKSDSRAGSNRSVFGSDRLRTGGVGATVVVVSATQENATEGASELRRVERVEERVEHAVHVAEPQREQVDVHVDRPGKEGSRREDDEVRDPANGEGHHDRGERHRRFGVGCESRVLLFRLVKHFNGAFHQSIDSLHLLPGDEKYPHVHHAHDEQRREVSQNGHQQHVHLICLKHARTRVLQILNLLARGVDSSHDGQEGHEEGEDPDAGDDPADAAEREQLHVAHGRRDGVVALEADDEQVQDGHGAQHHVERDEDVAEHPAQGPLLERKIQLVHKKPCSQGAEEGVDFVFPAGASLFCEAEMTACWLQNDCMAVGFEEQRRTGKLSILEIYFRTKRN